MRARRGVSTVLHQLPGKGEGRCKVRAWAWAGEKVRTRRGQTRPGRAAMAHTKELEQLSRTFGV